MKKLIINLFIFGSPLIFFLLFFAIDDPFGVIYKDDCLAATSEDMLVIRKYLNEYETKAPSAFIFGNSRTHAFKKYKCGNSNEFFFDFGCPGESTLNIKKKLQLVIDKQQNVKNVVILIDDGILENTDNAHRFYQGPVYNHTPESSNISNITFYSNYIKYYFSDYFFIKHVYYRLTGNYREEWMKDAFAPPGVDKNYACVNYPTLADSLLETDLKEYKRIFKPDYNTSAKKKIKLDVRDIEHLTELAKMLRENKIHYKVIYPPNFHKRNIEPEIKKTLSELFEDNFFDFSGVNKITTDTTLNYENLHFTYRAANMMMDSMCVNAK